MGIQWALGLFILLSVSLFSLFFIVELAAQPRVLEKEKALAVAKEYGHLEGETRVQVYNGKESYYSVFGKNQDQQEVIVLVPEKESEIFVYAVNQGISQKEAAAIAQKEGAQVIDRVTFGRLDGQPIWEVKSGTSYYAIAFETGNLVEKTGL